MTNYSENQSEPQSETLEDIQVHEVSENVTSQGIEDMQANENEHQQRSEQAHPEGHGHESEQEHRESHGRLAQFKKELEQLPDAEARLQKSIEFMESSLSLKGSPDFRSFWDVRTQCLELFKDNVSPTMRQQMWAKFSELSKEARRLKQILDEQSAFAAEQIEIAIQALENDIARFDEQVKDGHIPENFPHSKALEKHHQLFVDSQKQLNILNAQASRINALRKELLKTEMRIRHKNKFFQRLSSAGDAVFPKRKEIIKQVSDNFLADVEEFIENNFKEEDFSEPLFAMRDEIKTLQAMAKVLTLNTQTFNQSRLRLSECWDKLKNFEKERKKSRAQQKTLFRQNAQAIFDRIQKLGADFNEGTVNVPTAFAQMDDIVGEMRRTELGRDELKELRSELSNVRRSVQDKAQVEEDHRNQQEAEKERQKREKIQVLRQKLESLVETSNNNDADTINKDREEISKEIAAASSTKAEKQEFERLLKKMRDLAAEKKEQALMSLPNDKRQALEQLKELLKQRKDRRQQIKTQLEQFRKSSGSSNLDFEQAMSVNAQIQTEKENLEKANQGIREIEIKISDLESNL